MNKTMRSLLAQGVWLGFRVYLEVTASLGLPLSEEGILGSLSLQPCQHTLHILPSPCARQQMPFLHKASAASGMFS